jgi:SAM-dependent methyltransferase
MDSTLKEITDLYTTNLVKYGDESRAVGWNTPECQELRFEKLTSVSDVRNNSITINDYGCGYGAHLDYLLAQGHQVSTYHGYDLSKEMLACARKRHATFAGLLDLHRSSILATFADYTFVSGTFNVCFEATNEEWSSYILQKLNEVNHFSKRGFSFNMLSTYVDWKQPNLYYGDPLYWFDHCKKNFSHNVSLLHDYHLYEWTIVVKK